VTDDRAEWLEASAQAYREAQERAHGAYGMLATGIIAAHDTGMPIRAIAESVGLSPARVHQIVKGRPA
jgi:hypothetical protein